MADRPKTCRRQITEARLEAIKAGFQGAAGNQGMYQVHMANAAQLNAEGMAHMVVGLRAVYVLLEQVQKQIRLS